MNIVEEKQRADKQSLLVCLGVCMSVFSKIGKRNWVFATNSNFLILISWQPYGGNP